MGSSVGLRRPQGITIFRGAKRKRKSVFAKVIGMSHGEDRQRNNDPILRPRIATEGRPRVQYTSTHSRGTGERGGSKQRASTNNHGTTVNHVIVTAHARTFQTFDSRSPPTEVLPAILKRLFISEKRVYLGEMNAYTCQYTYVGGIACKRVSDFKPARTRVFSLDGLAPRSTFM